MKTSYFVIAVLLSGASAGLIHGTVNFAIVEPYIDQAIKIENQNLFASGEKEDTLAFWVEYDGYRTWQKGGQILAGVILGTSIGSLFGIVFALSRDSLPGSTDIKKALALSGMMWLTLYVVPFIKYPANPPGVGDGETLALRAALYLSFVAISGFGAVGFHRLSKRLQRRKKLLALAGYGVLVSVAFLAMPDNPDEMTAPANLVNEFRIMSVLGVSSFWLSVAVILGLLWSRFNLHREAAPSYN